MTSMNERNESDKNVKNRGYVTAKKDQSEQAQHTNKISQKYVTTLKRSTRTTLIIFLTNVALI